MSAVTSRGPSPLQRRVLIVLAALDEKRPGPVLTRDLERVLERSGEAPVYGPNLRASCRRLEDAGWKHQAGFAHCAPRICSWLSN